MPDTQPLQATQDEIPKVEIPKVEIRTNRGISIIWLIPIIAALIGGWLTYTTLSERGPEVTIKFSSAEGLEAGATKLKYKEVEVGHVKEIALSKDLSQVVVIADMVKGAEAYLTENARFWIVRPRIGTTGVSGLGTLFSGVYIGLEPGAGDSKATEFVGLNAPPAIMNSEAGQRFTLKADKRGPLKIGSPVYFSDFRVGQITDLKLEVGNNEVRVEVFIEKPHNELVRENTRFWNSSGIEVSVNTDGVNMQISSLESLIAGGIAFDMPDAGADKAKRDTVFKLYNSHANIGAPTYTEKISYIMYFNNSVRGLDIGAPVEFRGVKVGTVRDINLEFDSATGEPRIPILIDLEPERVPESEANSEAQRGFDKQKAQMAINQLVENKGFRGQLATGSLLTGKLFISLDFFPNSKTKKIQMVGDYPEFPTVPTTLDELKTSLTSFLADINKLPLSEISQNILDATEGLERLVNDPNLKTTIHSANKTQLEINKFTADLNKKLMPLLSKADKTLGLLDDDSPLSVDLANTLKELSSAARSIRLTADYLKQNPNSLIYGKQ